MCHHCSRQHSSEQEASKQDTGNGILSAILSPTDGMPLLALQASGGMLHVLVGQLKLSTKSDNTKL